MSTVLHRPDPSLCDTRFERLDDGSFQEFVTVEFYDYMVGLLTNLRSLDLEFARAVCADHGIDIDALSDDHRYAWYRTRRTQVLRR